VSCVAEKTDVAFLDIGIRLVDPESPGLNLLSDGEVTEDLAVELGIRLEEIFDGKTIGSPGLCSVVALLAGEEAVV
jgi:hypothetical protein